METSNMEMEEVRRPCERLAHRSGKEAFCGADDCFYRYPRLDHAFILGKSHLRLLLTRSSPLPNSPTRQGGARVCH